MRSVRSIYVYIYIYILKYAYSFVLFYFVLIKRLLWIPVELGQSSGWCQRERWMWALVVLTWPQQWFKMTKRPQKWLEINEIWFSICCLPVKSVVLEAGSRAGTSNDIPQILWDVITCPCPWYLLVALHSYFAMTPISSTRTRVC